MRVDAQDQYHSNKSDIGFKKKGSLIIQIAPTQFVVPPSMNHKISRESKFLFLSKLQNLEDIKEVDKKRWLELTEHCSQCL